MSAFEEYSPDRNWKAGPGPEHTVQIFKLTGKGPRLWVTYPGHRDGIHGRQGNVLAIVWFTNSTHLVTGSDNGSIHLLTPDGQQRGKLRAAQDNSPVTSFKILPDNTLIAYSDQNTIGTWANCGFNPS